MNPDIKKPEDIKIVFMGTPDFAVPTLQALIAEGFDLKGVVTRADSAKGRGRKVSESPVKTAALSHDIPLLQPKSAKDPAFIDELTSLTPDFIVVVAYGKILPSEVLHIPLGGCINVHFSLLPAWRGASPVSRAIITGDELTGVATMLMDTGLDTGPVYLVEETPIGKEETAGDIYERLGKSGSALLIKTIKGIAKGELNPSAQNDTLASLAPQLKKEDGRIAWGAKAREVDRLVRGVSPWPGAFTTLNGKTVKIHSGRLDGSTSSNHAEPGTIVKTGEDIAVATGEGTYHIDELQLENKKRMKAAELLRGFKIVTGERFE